MAMSATLNRPFLAADESFIRFDNAANAAHRRKIARAHSFANTMAQKPCTFESDPQSAMQLVRTNAFLAGAYKVNSSQPIAHGYMAILKNGADLNGKWLPARIAFVKSDAAALALKQCGAVDHAAMRAHATICPNQRFEIGISSCFVVKAKGGKDGFGHAQSSLWS